MNDREQANHTSKSLRLLALLRWDPRGPWATRPAREALAGQSEFPEILALTVGDEVLGRTGTSLPPSDCPWRQVEERREPDGTVIRKVTVLYDDRPGRTWVETWSPDGRLVHYESTPRRLG